MRIRSLLALGPVLLASACADLGTEPNASTTVVKHAYVGHYSGSFSASGKLTLPSDGSEPAPHSYAVGIRSDSSNSVVIVGYQLKSDSVGDVTMLMVTSDAVGTYETSLMGCLFSESACGIGLMARGVRFQSPNAAGTGSDSSEVLSELITIEGGSIAIEESSSTRIQGAFQGPAIVLATSGEGEVVGEMTISRGEFDVPVIHERDLPNLVGSAVSAQIQAVRSHAARTGNLIR